MTISPTLQTMVENMINSPFINGSVDDIVESLKKLKYLKLFNFISDSYYSQQCQLIAEALEELYNVKLEDLNLEDNVKTQTIEECSSWEDNVFRVKTSLQASLEDVSTVINDAYMKEHVVNIRCIATSELIRARLRSYNGDAYALDIIDTQGNIYSILDTDLIYSIVKGRKVTFDNTYGFISITAPNLYAYGTAIYDLIHNVKNSNTNYITFITYSDLLNMTYNISYDNVDIYMIEEVTEWLRTTGIDSLKLHDNMVVYIGIDAEDDAENASFITVIGRAISNIEFFVDTAQVVLDKYSSNLLQQVKVHTINGITAEILLPHDLDTDELEAGASLTLAYDTVTLV